MLFTSWVRGRDVAVSVNPSSSGINGQDRHDYSAQLLSLIMFEVAKSDGVSSAAVCAGLEVIFFLLLKSQSCLS